MQFGVLGPLEVVADDGAAIVITARRQRALLVALLSRPGAAISGDLLVDALWVDGLPADPRNALQHYVSRLRGRLGRGIVGSSAGGYTLEVAPDAVDAVRFEALARAGRAALAGGAPREALGALDGALGLWRGEPYADLPDAAFAVTERARLVEVRDTAIDDRSEAMLALGAGNDGGDIVPALAEAAAAAPLRERRWGQLMRALYRDGRQAEALATYQHARARLVEELGLEPGSELGELEQRILRHDPSLDVPRVRRPPRRSYRPLPPLTSFVGRAEAMARLAELVARGRAVTVRGPVGVGKTRLVLEWAATVSGGDGREVAVAELEGVRQDTLLGAAVAAATGVSEDPARAVIDRLVDQLHDRELVLVLDGGDRFPSAARDLAGELLAACPGLRVVATGHESLGLAGEVQLVLTGLPVAPVAPVAPDEGRAVGDGVQLFVDRVRLRRSGFEPSGSELATIAAIVDAVDGLPLAIELAAARTLSASLEEIRTGIVAGRDALASLDETVPRRHASLHAALDWAISLLPPDRRRTLAELSLLPGPFVTDTARAVASAPAEELSMHLADLAGRALLRADTTPTGTRLVVPAATQRFARMDGGAGGATARLVAHHALLAAAVEQGLRGPEQLAWLGRADTEADNLAFAIGRALDTSPGTAVGMAARLARYWDWRGLVAAANDAFAAVLRVDADADEEIAVEDRSGALMWAGFFAWEGGDLPLAAERMDQAVEVSAAGPPGLHAPALGGRALVWRTEGRTADAALTLRTAIDQACAARDRWFEAWLATALVPCELELGDDRAAAKLARRALDGFRHLGDRRGEGWALVARASVLENRGRHGDATAAAADAVLLARSVDDARTVAAAVELRARLEHARGALEHATELLACVDAMQLRRGAPEPPSKDAAHLDRLVDLEDRLGHERFTTAWKRGASADMVELAVTR